MGTESERVLRRTNTGTMEEYPLPLPVKRVEHQKYRIADTSSCMGVDVHDPRDRKRVIAMPCSSGAVLQWSQSGQTDFNLISVSFPVPMNVKNPYFGFLNCNEGGCFVLTKHDNLPQS